LKPWSQNCSEKQWIDPQPINTYQFFEKTSRLQFQNFIKGVMRYRSSDFYRLDTNPKVFWQKGSARLFEYVPQRPNNKTLFIVPSLVNRSTILDLLPDNSLVNYFTQQGYRAFLLDWGAPGEAEVNFSLEDYYSSYLISAFTKVTLKFGPETHLFGYCMGGIFTLALAEHYPKHIKKLILLATPWDFHSKNMSFPKHLLTKWQQFCTNKASEKLITPDFIQFAFFTRDPFQTIKKYAAFLKMEPAAANKFIAVEDWLNDGVPLTHRVAQECLNNWYLDNATKNHDWHIGNRPLFPQNIKCPSFVIAPKNDRVVSSDATKNLTTLIPQSELYEPDTGHVGLMISKHAQKMWDQIGAWLKK
jgi:poly[(R)-3-hydroxyalkanoate] polymerase subunit PhaC